MTLYPAEVFVSSYLVTDGQLVGSNSILSLNSVAFRVTENGYEQIATFEANLERCPGAKPDGASPAIWRNFPGAWRKIRKNLQPPDVVMQRYLDWLKALPGEPVFVSSSSIEFGFVYWYLLRFTGKKPFGESSLCRETYFRSMFKLKSFGHLSWFHIPTRFKSKHSQSALGQAIKDGKEFAAMYHENVMLEKPHKTPVSRSDDVPSSTP